MGGGPRTYPGGVSKWQWKRMQAKKAKQLLRARLARERQVYEMRKRAELAAAVSELERPWEVVDKAPKLFSVTADEQLKVLADRFQKPGGFDLWSEKDGPQLFETVEGLPSARFFPKGVVHSIKPYGRITDGNSDESDRELGYDQNEDRDYVKNSGNANGRSGKLDGRRGIRTGSGSGSGRDGLDKRDNGSNWRKESKRENLKVFDMNMQDDGSYAVSKKETEIEKSRRRPERK
ncbi:uncharacterized protein LOC143581836 [Bidens hawaiensis]|uniref:uncharacterized protein LOC143581836 n=1 Tax=Bidens hawaiensis TaxID=980011 RepID=UPI00404A59CE